MTSSYIEKRENRLRNISKEETVKRIKAEEKRIEAEKKRIQLEKKLIGIHIIVKEYADNPDENDEQCLRQKILEILDDCDLD